MKNLLIYTNSAKEFSDENKTLVKLQIDNSLDLGWKREDILLFTNFPYEYNGVKSKIVSDKLDVEWDRTSNKIFVIKDLLEKGLLQQGELYWYHDFDAYQNEVITEEELGLNKEGQIGLTGYGYKNQINGGSFFFRVNWTTYSTFSAWCRKTLEIVRTRADEKTMTDMALRPIKWRHESMGKWYDTIKVEGAIAWTEPTPDGSEEALTYTEYKLLDISYNFGQRCPQLRYKHSKKPLKVLHFHPYYPFNNYNGYLNIDIFMNGHNKHKVPMMSDRLAKIFKQYGY